MSKFESYVKSLFILLMVVLVGCTPVSRAQGLDTPAAEPQTPIYTEGIGSLWIDMSIGPDLIDWFNQNARPNDIARVDHVSMIDQLDRIDVGRRLVVFKNVADAELLVPRLVDQMDVIGYNLEHGPSNRPDEQADPVGSIQRMRALADTYDKELAFGPDRRFALSDGPAMAPYADIFVLQVQRAQTEPQTVREFVLPLVQQLVQVNPELQVSVQVRTEGDMMAVADLLASMENSLDGISILTSPETTEIAEALVEELRPPMLDSPIPQPATSLPSIQESGAAGAQANNTGETPADAPPAPTEAHAAILTTPGVASRRVATPVAPTSLTATTSDDSAPVRRWILFGGLLLTGVVVAALIASVWVYSYQNARPQ